MFCFKSVLVLSSVSKYFQGHCNLHYSLFIPALIILKYVWNVIIQTNITQAPDIEMFDSVNGIYEEVQMHSIINTYSIQ